MRKVLFVCIVLGATIVAAKDKKDYPYKGTVVSFHAQAEVKGDENSVDTYQRRVYVIKTDSGRLEVTGWENAFKARKRPPLTVGQEVKYRTDGKYVYTILDDGKKHRFYLMSAAHQ
jgi:hypothetical protein